MTCSECSIILPLLQARHRQAFIEQVGSESLKDHVALPIADFTDSRAGNATTLFFASADFLGFRISLLPRR